MTERKVVAALDIGTTSLRCHCYDEKAVLLGTAFTAVQLSYPKPNFVEIDAEDIFLKVVQVINDAVKSTVCFKPLHSLMLFQGSGLEPQQINCLGMSCQRSSFVTWSKSTGKPFHPIITWRDLRADSTVRSFNSSVWFKTFKAFVGVGYHVTRKKRLLVASQMRIMNQQVNYKPFLKILFKIH